MLQLSGIGSHVALHTVTEALEALAASIFKIVQENEYYIVKGQAH